MSEKGGRVPINRKIKVLLILPDGNIHKMRLGPYQCSMREAPLTMAVLASLAPDDVPVDFRIVDGSVERIPGGCSADLIGISVITGTANKAYQLARHYRSRGIPVVLGGVHVTLMPEEARAHCDSIVVGAAELSWPRLLRDFSRGEMKGEYREPPDFQRGDFELPVPRYDLLRRRRYIVPNTVMASRGCSQICDFCTIPALGQAYRKRRVWEVIRDIKSINGKLVVFNDVSFADDVEYVKELLTAMIPMDKRWGGLASTKLLNHPELIELMAESGCQYLLIGFESFDTRSLQEIHKGFNRKELYKDLITILHDNNIAVQGTFIFGFDNDDETVFERTVQAVNDLKVDIPRYSILTPYPGTKLFKRLQDEGRILTCNWENYDTMHVVFEPHLMTPEELYYGFKQAYRDTFRMSHVLRRSGGFRFKNLINFAGNLTYKKFSRTLRRHPRYALPYINE